MNAPSPTPSAPNLTQRPPRSPRVRLGGYAMLPRILDWDILQWVNERANHSNTRPKTACCMNRPKTTTIV
jgi:hypothetical protein